MHGSVLSTSGRPMYMYGEVQSVTEICKKAQQFLLNTKPVRTGLALHVSCSNSLKFDSQGILDGFHYKENLLDSFYHPMLHSQFRPDLLEPSLPLDGYRVIFTPFLLNLDEGNLRDLIEMWVLGGGTWIVGPLSDIRTACGTKCIHSPFGSLETFAGITLKYSIPCNRENLFPAEWKDGTLWDGHAWFDGFELKGAKGLAFYTEDARELSSLAASLTRKSGKAGSLSLAVFLRNQAFRNFSLRYVLLPV